MRVIAIVLVIVLVIVVVIVIVIVVVVMAAGVGVVDTTALVVVGGRYRRYLIQRIGDDTTRGETIENECLWYSNYTFLPSDLECILTYCDQVLEDIFIGMHQFV